MKLMELLNNTTYKVLQGEADINVTDIVQDSRKVKPGDVFVCIKGSNMDGHDLIPDVLKAGVTALVVEKEIEVPIGITVILVKNTRNALAHMSCAYFDHPAKKLKTIGITGTKGKTTTTYMVKHILEQSGIKTGLIGTIEVLIGEDKISSVNTTPESYTLQKYLKQMVDAGCEAVVMEVSSQGLMLDRVAGIEYDYGVFTNISPDHIGPNEHSSYEEYMYYKSLLFRQCKTGIINIDDDNYENIIKDHTCKIESFGLSGKADLRATNLVLYRKDSILGIRFHVEGTMNFEVKLNMPGEFNVHNALCAIAICKHFNIQIKDIIQSFETIKVKGRLEVYNTNQPYSVIIDYAHNEVSLKELLSTLKDYNPKRLVCLFGCGGNRSKLRRYEMGKVSAQLADLTIVTSDNPRFEEPADIIADIVSSVEKEKGNYISIEDRREAIRYCIENAIPGDIIVLAGKGHELYQEIKGEKFTMDEREILKNVFEQLK
ncbi:UDP-N-acetylmuramoylalanyl-D-glutamate--2,6-diaminopimelate ligase [Mobilisporobacter senegalensis]|uniref:UDP-N-acetylmuramoyl-L-alanyl-D-glutamate--2,6-diaminopimelate ligase n=1 Tax=Mobilisporobacter senegalensis TaxID=1329262 RepID=A0A3N1XVT0_9FIRM|nr:UDP-N-acetylmuramoyl-L-alanyl-D-glutamate--2,6-diaminopimelate ligase [Mobilisporobacter senegalensis]ROR30719.1 UDP-N-acetylmuramoylalanyl-D-glutamate--2,6-diaminopimelate ligase [Mobilisporobacter senegalensis]